MFWGQSTKGTLGRKTVHFHSNLQFYYIRIDMTEDNDPEIQLSNQFFSFPWLAPPNSILWTPNTIHKVGLFCSLSTCRDWWSHWCGGQFLYEEEQSLCVCVCVCVYTCTHMWELKCQTLIVAHNASRRLGLPSDGAWVVRPLVWVALVQVIYYLLLSSTVFLTCVSWEEIQLKLEVHRDLEPRPRNQFHYILLVKASHRPAQILKIPSSKWVYLMTQ